MGGLCTYYHDLIYLSAFVQVMAIFTDRAWLCFGVVRAGMHAMHAKGPNPLLHRCSSTLPHAGVDTLDSTKLMCAACVAHKKACWLQVPAYAAYQLWINVLGPYIQPGGRPKVEPCSCCLAWVGVYAYPLQRCSGVHVQEKVRAETPAERKKREKIERKQEKKQSRTVYR